MLFLHGTRDPVAPRSEGRRSFDAAGEPKRVVELAEAGHTVATYTDRGRAQLVAFFERCLAARGSPAPSREVH